MSEDEGNMRSVILALIISGMTIGDSGVAIWNFKNQIEQEQINKITNQISFNTQNPFLLEIKKDKMPKVVAGESNNDKAKRLAAQPAPAPAPATAPKVQAQVATAKYNGGGNFDPIYKAAGSKYGVPWQILAAVHSVETGQRGDTPVTSYAGAQGPMQFMPGTWRAYGVDADGDGVANINGVVDAIHGAANYLSANYKKTGSWEHAIWQYNHSQAYVNKVLSIAKSFGYVG